MEEKNDFNTALKKSQTLGYAENLPNNDINGLDTLHKISILCTIAFGIKVNYKKIPFLGIQSITKEDIFFVNKLGYKIKLLGLCYNKQKDLRLTVAPFLVSKTKELSSVNENLNAILEAKRERCLVPGGPAQRNAQGPWGGFRRGIRSDPG